MAPAMKFLAVAAALAMASPVLAGGGGDRGLRGECFVQNIVVRSPRVAREASNHHQVAVVGRRLILGAGFAAAAPLVLAGRADAKGQFAKIDVGKMVDDYAEVEKKGPSLYDAESETIVKERMAKVEKEWGKMTKEVDTALAKNLCNDAKGSLGLRMGTIKQGMREIARIAAGGDVLVRDKGEGRAANFDFGKGEFTFKEIAQVPEDMFASINRLVENCRMKDPEAAGEEWETVKSTYVKFKALLAAQKPAVAPEEEEEEE